MEFSQLARASPMPDEVGKGFSFCFGYHFMMCGIGVRLLFITGTQTINRHTAGTSYLIFLFFCFVTEAKRYVRALFRAHRIQEDRNGDI